MKEVILWPAFLPAPYISIPIGMWIGWQSFTGSCLGFLSDLKQNKQNQTTWSVMKSLLPGYEIICIFQVWHTSFEHIWTFSWFDKPKCWFSSCRGSSGMFPGHCAHCSPFLERNDLSTMIYLLLAWRTRADISYPAIAARGWLAVHHFRHKW